MSDLTNYDEETPALSPYIAQMLDAESAEHAYTFHRLLGGKRRKTTDAQTNGLLFHAALLEGGKGIEVIDADAFRSTAAKAARDDALSRGLIPIVAPKWEMMQPALERIRANMEAVGFPLMGGHVEAKLQWQQGASDGDVLCHARIDWLSDDWGQIVDLKTTDGSIHPDNCAATILRNGGAIQEAAYRSAVSTLRPEVAGRELFTFLFVETREPYSVVPIECADSMREIGESKWQRAVELWSRCLRNDDWPGYSSNGPVRVHAPAWALAREIEEQSA